MNECNDYWCDHYGKTDGHCDHCVKKDDLDDKSELHVILKKRADKLMALDKNSKRYKGRNR